MARAPEAISPAAAPKKLVLVVGPTASGKTRFGVALCEALRVRGVVAEIVNADSMQVYRGFAVGTAKPSASEVAAVPHHMLGFVAPTEVYDASRFARDCARTVILSHPQVAALAARGTLAVLVGGTNLYIEGLLWPSVIDWAGDPPEADSPREPESPGGDAPNDYTGELEGLSEPDLHARLAAVDPERAAQLHPNDRKRIMRSLDVLRVHGVTHSALMRARREERDAAGVRYDALAIVLDSDPAVHRARIRARVREMLEVGFAHAQGGLLAECRELVALSARFPALDRRRGIFQSIAYKELIPLLGEAGADAAEGGEEPSAALLARCADVLETRTWRYAQRQRTWLANRLVGPGLTRRVVITDGMPRSRADPAAWDRSVSECADAVLAHLQ